MKLSIVIPVYNEIRTLPEVLEKLRKLETPNLDREFIIIDDCSTDGTVDFLRSIQETSWRTIYHSTNQGKGAALAEGFKHAAGDIVIIQDADLEYDPAEIPKVIEPIVNKISKVVYGSRYLLPDPKLKFWHSAFNKLFTKLSNLFTGQQLTDVMTCYKAFDKQTLDKISPWLDSKRFGFEPEVTILVSREGVKIYEVPIAYRPRYTAEGKHMNFFGELETLVALIKYSIRKPSR